MRHKFALAAKISLAAFIALAIAVLIFSRANRRATVRTYFRLETAVIEHWPLERGKWKIQELVPFMCRNGR